MKNTLFSRFFTRSTRPVNPAVPAPGPEEALANHFDVAELEPRRENVWSPGTAGGNFEPSGPEGQGN